ncbi:macrophage mannose receptor 1-like [Mercenaria mercenaria]|uniref:macrophage mannose receptor 1-like n=1 Tax=Mercenaria mercenaria TaxID=6596 RepID=UPI00234F9FC9|nr:macrophage mannose receptor 1-like [Mercenaria mercenaria]
MSSLTVYIFICAALTLTIVSGQKCPAGWYGYSLKSKCYRFVSKNSMTWQDARDFCQIHGGDLLRIDSNAEQNWIFQQLKNMRNHSHIPLSHWWVGMNNREFLSKWEWADGAPVGSFIHWAPHEPNNHNGVERCGEIWGVNTFNDESCSTKYKFICWRNRGIPLTCDADRGWQSLNGACYKVYTQRRNWNAAQHQCSHDGAAMVTIDNLNDEISMHDFAVNIKQPLWIGLYTQKVGNQAQWMWTNNTALTTNYWHGTPHVNRANLNNTCAVVSNSLPTKTAWNPSSCRVNRPFVCRKPEGVCLPGWVGHRGNCWQFNAQYKLNFNAAVNFCKQQGATLLKIARDSDEFFLISYLDELRDSGVTNFWIGASDKHPTDGQYKWADGSTITFKHWAAPHNTPTNTKNRKDCVYVRTNDASGLWRTTVACQRAYPFICKIPMGRNVTIPPRTPRPQFGCPADWKQFQQWCFKVSDRALPYAQARSDCQKTQGADLAKITAANMQGFVNGKVKQNINYWIGLNDRVTNNVYVWNDETIPLTGYTNWRKGEPNNYRHHENCAVLNNGQWNDYNCAARTQYICSMTAGSPLASLPPTTPQADWTIKCGPGWESNPLTAYCYMFVDQPLSWLDALTQCRAYRGQLVSIESSQEINYLAARMQSMNSLAVWTGANDRGSEGGWKWINGKPFAFFNWAPGQPSGHALGQGQDCVAMFTQSALWDDVDCTTRNGYICEKQGNVPRTTVQTTPTVKIPAGMVLGCPRYWLPFRNSCYRVIRRGGTQAAAQTSCGRMGAKLVSIFDRNENNFIAGNLPKGTHSWDGFWIGLNDIQVDNRFQWSDGSKVTYTNWNTNEPNNYMNRNEDCVTMLLSNGKWNDERCADTRTGYICKARKKAVSATQAPYIQGCNWNAYGVGANCYKLVNYGKPMTWDAANSYCNRTFKGSLATVNDRILQAFLSSMLVWKSGYFWIGLSDKSSPGKYTWKTGDSVQYTNWYSTHTGNERSTCVAMEATPPTGLWVNKNCSTPSFSICQFPRTGYTPTTTPTPWPNVNCPSGWTASQGFCYKAFANQSTVKTWMEAVAYCQTFGGNLPSFHINNNDSILTTLLANYRGRPFWIGFNDRDTEKGFQWSDGSAVDYTNWNPGEPNDFHGYEDCVVYNPGAGWNDQNCYFSSRFVCAVPRGTNFAAVTPPPTGVPSAQYCGDPSWLLYKGNCYQLSPATGDNSSLPWYDANTYCMNQQSNLASMHSQDEHSFILQYITKRPAKIFSYWIGLDSLNGDGFKWTDQTPLDFDFWSPNEPNNYFGSEQCVEMRRAYGLWNDDHCSQAKAFVCKKPQKGAATIVTPSPYPSGGCAQGFTRAPGGRNKCFYIGGANPSLRLNYTAAYQLCRKFGTGYDIASIEDIFEQEFILTMTKGITYPLWIGMNDRHGNNKFYWQNSAPVLFTNWDRGEPTSSHQGSPQQHVQNCVLMRTSASHAGRWADQACSPKLGYICQSKQDPNLPVMKPPTGSCKTGYSFYMGSCYKVSKTSKNWNDAQADCKNDNGNLASVTSIQESAFIHVLVNGAFQYWVGLSDTQTRGLYQWSDGWPVFFSNWGWKEPSYGRKNTTGCVLVNMRGKWNDTDCTRKLHYVCKISQGGPPKPTAVSTGKCSDPSSIPNAANDFCYKVYAINGRSWPEANYLCQNKGQQLVSIHSQAELDFVVQLVRQAKAPNPSYRPNVWIGLQQGGKGSYKWSDGSTMNFIKWKVGEPSNLGTHGQLEQCVELDRDNATYNDISCFTNRGYVCKSPKVMPSTAPYIPGSGGPGRPTGSNGLPIYVATTGSGGVLIGQGSSKLPSITNANGQPVANGALGQSGSNVQTNNSNLGLSNGGIAGVVIACVVIIVLVAFLLVYLKRMGKIKPPAFDGSLGFENATYSRSNDKIQLDSDA